MDEPVRKPSDDAARERRQRDRRRDRWDRWDSETEGGLEILPAGTFGHGDLSKSALRVPSRAKPDDKPASDD